MLKFKSIIVLTLNKQENKTGKAFAEHSSMQIWGGGYNYKNLHRGKSSKSIFAAPKIINVE